MNTGLFTPSATMAQQLETAAQIAGEKIWRMPLVEPYALPTIL
jgi:leucyl aminopeptidase